MPIKRCLTPLDVREMQAETTVCCLQAFCGLHDTAVSRCRFQEGRGFAPCWNRAAGIEEYLQQQILAGTQSTGRAQPCWQRCEAAHLWKTIWQFLTKLSNPIPRYEIPREIKTCARPKPGHDYSQSPRTGDNSDVLQQVNAEANGGPFTWCNMTQR